VNEIHQPILDFQAAHAAALAGRASLELYAADPHRLIVEAVS